MLVIDSIKTYISKLTVLQVRLETNIVNTKYFNITSYRVKHNKRFNLLMDPRNVCWVLSDLLSRKIHGPNL